MLDIELVYVKHSLCVVRRGLGAKRDSLVGGSLFMLMVVGVYLSITC